jgi:pyroglutamyl-peptidase
MTEPCVLLTGFEPFADEPINPSQEVVRRLDGAMIGGHRVIGAILPVAFADAPAALADALDRHRPALVIALGQAGGRSEISLERIAVNLIDARIADNLGLQPIDTEVIARGPSAYFATLPVKAICARLQALGIPAAVSLSAGSFVCNQVFYWLCHLLAADHPQTRGGFVHVPWLPEQALRHSGQPWLPLDMMIAGMHATIECALRTTEDLRITGGTIH